MNVFKKVLTKDEEIEQEEQSTPREEEEQEQKLEKVEPSREEQLEKKLQTMVVQVKENNIKFEIATKIKEIDDLYQKGVIEYTESIYRYNIELEKIKNEIEIAYRKTLKEEETLLDIENYIKYKSKELDIFNQKFTQKVNSISELRSEYREIMAENDYKQLLSRKEREIYEFVDEIEEIELSLLNKELQHINLLESLEPKKNHLEELKLGLKELELEKSYFESTGLQKISRFQIENQILENIEAKDIVDAEVMETP